jgi:VWFA-related protein
VIEATGFLMRKRQTKSWVERIIVVFRSIFYTSLGRKRYELSLALIMGFVGLLFLLIPTTAISDSALTINQINIEQFPEIKIYLTASDEKGYPLWGLEASHFTVREDGSAVEVREVAPLGAEKEPLSVVLAIDRSGSMKGQPIQDALKAAKDFVGEMRAIDQVGVVSFDDNITVVSPLSADKDTLSKAIDGITVGKDTALNDAVMKSLELLSTLKGRRAVVALTDGKENRSKAKREEVINEALLIGVPVITVGLGDEVDAQAISDMAESSGGRAFIASESSELPNLYRIIAQQLLNQYRLALQSPKTLDDTWHTLRIEANTVQGKAEVERLYLATEKPVLDTSVLIEYRKKSEQDELIKIGVIALVIILVLVIVFAVIVRYKKIRGDVKKK